MTWLCYKSISTINFCCQKPILLTFLYKCQWLSKEISSYNTNTAQQSHTFTMKREHISENKQRNLCLRLDKRTQISFKLHPMTVNDSGEEKNRRNVYLTKWNDPIEVWEFFIKLNSFPIDYYFKHSRTGAYANPTTREMANWAKRLTITSETQTPQRNCQTEIHNWNVRSKKNGVFGQLWKRRRRRKITKNIWKSGK